MYFHNETCSLPFWKLCQRFGGEGRHRQTSPSSGRTSSRRPHPTTPLTTGKSFSSSNRIFCRITNCNINHVTSNINDMIPLMSVLNEDICYVSWIQCKKEDKHWICKRQKMDFEDKRWPNTGQGQNVDKYWTYSGHILDLRRNVDKMWDTDIVNQHHFLNVLRLSCM